MKNTKVIYTFFVLIISMQWSCSVNDSMVEAQEQIDQKNNRSGILTMADLTTTIIDGKIVNDKKIIDSKMKEAFATHFNFIDKKLLVFTTKDEHEKYLNENISARKAFEKSHSIITTNKKVSNLPLVQEFIDSHMKLNRVAEPTETEKLAFYNQLSQIDGHHNSATFYFKYRNTDAKFFTEVSNIADTNILINCQAILPDGVYNLITNLKNVFDDVGESDAYYDGYIKNNSPLIYYVIFKKNTNYNGSLSYATLLGHSTVKLTKQMTHPGGSPAQSTYFLKF